MLQFCPVDWLLNYGLNFEVNWIDVRAVRLPQIWKFIGVTTISEIVAPSNWRQRMIHRLVGLTQYVEKITAAFTWQ